MLLYQVFCGRLTEANVLDHPGRVFLNMKELNWATIKQAGFDCVYLLGLFDYRGPIVVPDDHQNRVPSLFAVTNHTAFHPDLGSPADLKQLLGAIHQAQLKVITDFIPNHTGTSHPWVQSHPEYYQQDGQGFIRAFSQDVYLLNYEEPKVREEMTAVMQFITDFGFDGLRCDMAHLAPISFWRDAIPKIKSRAPETVFLAEAYSDSVFNWQPITDLMAAGFDAVYHEFLYRNIKWRFIDHQPITYIADHLNYCLKLPYRQQLMHYLANHDDPLINPDSLEGLAALTLLLPGFMLIPSGMLNGFGHRLAHHYVEILPKDYSEFSTIPQWFKNLSFIKTALRPEIISVKTPAPGVITAQLELNHQPGILYVNLSPIPWSYPEVPRLLGTGLLGGGAGSGELMPGKAELFFLSQ